MSRRARGGSRRGRTSQTRQHRVSLVTSLALAVLALAGLVLGGLAWVSPRPNPTRLVAGQPAELGASPLFDPGSTVFSVPGTSARTAPAAGWGCVLEQQGRRIELTGEPDADAVGTRVVGGQGVVPVVTVGRTSEGAVLTCTATPGAPGPDGPTGTAMWVLPTAPGVPRVPLALVLAGIALAGLAAVIHPRARDIRPFGR